jgi:hypothetical protein
LAIAVAFQWFRMTSARLSHGDGSTDHFSSE